MPAPEIIKRLVQVFDDNLKFYASKDYNEAELRQEFLDPFFEALGWDVNNTRGFAPRYREVLVERPIAFQGSPNISKKPDYTFQPGGRPSFFVEAKRPNENLQNSSEFAFQLKAYAWNQHLPLSILTDFEEFVVYDCRRKPKKSEKPHTDCVMNFKYTDYLEKWDEIASIFSPDGIRKGAFDKFADDNTSKKGVSEVDDEFLKDIEKWRTLLAHNIALRNPDSIDETSLNYAIQMTIDRIIFLRICEDRGIEPFNQLREIASLQDVFGRLNDIFKRAELKYNSGLFSFKDTKKNEKHHDQLTPGLVIDDKVLKEIILSLYYPASSYNFKVLPVEILGQVYEQFLGKVIRLTPGHTAKIEDKPEVRKAGGVYYTPKYIVDYIVANTVGKLLEGKTPEEARRLRIVDPACGSGSFLLGAFQYLIDWHEDWYFNHDPEKWSRGKEPTLAPMDGGGYRISTPEKKRILVNNIYGVDIDTQAVEVTKLSLLLKVLEEESGQLSLGFEHALPDLGNNIKCGNSLIGWDYFDGQLVRDKREVERVNPFDWHSAFPEVFRQGGFDAVIGNPPWGADIDKELAYFHKVYPNSTYDHTDIFKLFIDKGINLLNENGYISLIVPNPLFRQRRYKDVRLILLSKKIEVLIDLGENVFNNVVAPSCIFVIQNIKSSIANQLRLIDLSKISEKSLIINSPQEHEIIVYQNNLMENVDNDFHITPNISRAGCKALGELKEIVVKDAGINYQRKNVGMQEKGKSNLSERLLYEGKRQSTNDFMFWKGSDINRYSIEPQTNRFCRSNFKRFIKSNESVSLNKVVYATVPKILIRQTADHIIATIDYMGVWFGRSIIAILLNNNIQYRIEYFLGLLNSRYVKNFYYNLVKEKGRVFAQVKLSKVKQLPIRTIDFTNPAEVKQHDRLVTLVERMLELHKRTPQTPHEKERLEREIASTDAQIDRLVYDLYGLTEEEIRIVEGT